MNQTHEAITREREEQAAARETMQREMERNRETMDQFRQWIQSMFNMLSALPQFRLPPEFLPRALTNPIQPGTGILQRPKGPRGPIEPPGADMEGPVRGLNSHVPTPRLEIPLFDGSKPRWWICQCEIFFQLYHISEVQRVTMAATYLDDMIDSWYQGWILAREREAGWNEFVEELCMRFGERSMSDVIEEFKMLKQTGTVTKYLDKFEELRALMCTVQPHLTE